MPCPPMRSEGGCKCENHSCPVKFPFPGHLGQRFTFHLFLEKKVEPPPSLRLPTGQASYGRAGKFKAIQMLRLNGRAHAQQPVIKGCLIHCGVPSFSIVQTSL
jgi:hypothetical protein